jgi:hypothetical protein
MSPAQMLPIKSETGCMLVLNIHPHCRLNDTPILPTRVVDIQTMSLYTSPPGETAQYTALSYRWAGISRLEPQETTFRQSLVVYHQHQCQKPSKMPSLLPASLEFSISG